MKRGLIFLVMLVSVLALSFAQSALSGTYRYSANAYITFIGNNFSGSWNRTSTMSGTYSVSGNRLTLNITGGTVGRNTWNWTIVDANTLRDHDGDIWRKEGGASQQPAQPPVSWTVNSPSDWIEMVNGVRSAGNNKTHIVTVSGTVSVIPTPSSGNTFGSVTGITVTIQGDGTITPSSNGSLLRIGGGQTVIVRDLTLKGRDNNNASVVFINESGSFRMEDGASVSVNTYSGDGGGVYVSGGTFTMQGNASVSGNNVRGYVNYGHGEEYYNGGGVYIESGAFTMLDNASVSGNSTGGDGGGVYVENGTFTMQVNTSVSGNTANHWGGGGGGVYVDKGTFTIRDNASVSDNTTGNTKSYGGGVYIRSGTLIMRDNASVSGNTAFIEGGGSVYVSYGTFTMQNNASVSGNIARNGSGGGVYIGSGYEGTFTMQDNATVSSNSASYGGGGVYVDNYGIFTMQGNSSVSSNTANQNGGGVYVGGRTFNMQSGTISGNTASQNGGGVYVGGGTFTKTGGTIYGNNETDARLRNTASSGHTLYNGNGRNWRNTTAGPTMNADTFGFWMND